MNIAVPIWLPEHILSYEPLCKDIAQSSHSCSECEDWMNQFIEGDSPALTNDCDGSLYDFKSMCGLWATVDQFKGMCASNEDYPDWMIKYSLGFASEILYALSGRQFKGLCERVVFPGCLDNDYPIAWQYLDTEYQRDRDYSGSLLSCSDSGCDFDVIKLPGLVNSISQIVIDGKVLPPSEYAIRDRNELILLDGSSWPKYNDISRSPYKLWPPAPTNITNNSFVELTWVDEWKIDSGYSEEVADPDWVLDFLARNPHAPLPIEEPWVETWLKENGLTYSKIPGDGCEVEDCWIITPERARELNTYPANQCCQAASTCGGSCGEPMPSNFCCGKGCGKPKCEQTVLVFDPTSCSCNNQSWVNTWMSDNDISSAPSSDNWVQEYLNSNNLDIVGSVDLEPIICCRDECGRNKDPLTGDYYVCICDDQQPVIRPEPCNGCLVPANSCVAKITGRPNECCACIDCVQEMPECNCNVQEVLPLPEGTDLSTAPWWVKNYFDPSLKKPEPTLPLNTAGFTGWVKDYFSKTPVAKEVKGWVIDYLDANPCTKVDPVFSNIDEPYEAHCKLYKWNTPDKEYINANTLGLDINYDPCKPSWVIKYFEGKCPPSELAILATVSLAKNIIGSICSTSCTPSDLAQISRGGAKGMVKMEMLDITKLKLSGMTGIYEVDLFINAVNPARLQRRGTALVSSSRGRTISRIR